MRKRLLYFDFITHFGGAQKSTVLLLRYLKSEFDLHVIDPYGVCAPYLNALEREGIPCTILLPGCKRVVIGYEGSSLKRFSSLASQLWSYGVLIDRLRKEVRRFRASLIWTNNAKALAVLSLAPGLRRYPVCLYARGWYRKHQVGPMSRWLIRRRADGIFAVSNATCSAMQSWGVRKEKIKVTYTTLAFTELIEKSAVRPQPLPSGNADGFKILVPASLLRTKGQHTVIHAARLLRKSEKKFVVWLAGDTGTGDRSGYVEYLKSEVNRLALRDHVLFLGWRDDLPALMKAADVVVLPTLTEGLPRVIQEAMILGKPVITTRVGGMADLVSDDCTGLLFDAEDSRALADRIARIMQDPALGRLLGGNAQAFMAKRFVPERQVRRVTGAIEETILNRLRRR